MTHCQKTSGPTQPRATYVRIRGSSVNTPVASAERPLAAVTAVQTKCPADYTQCGSYCWCVSMAEGCDGLCLHSNAMI